MPSADTAIGLLSAETKTRVWTKSHYLKRAGSFKSQVGDAFPYGKFSQFRNGMKANLVHDVSSVGIDGF